MKQLKKNITFLIILVIFSTFFINSISALTANSSSYSVGMFGTGMTTATPSSENYNSTVLTEAKGTTRNAANDLYTGNIGFFGDTIYHIIVSITSYTIYPTSAVQGSIIRLSISALNSESVWAVLTLPDSTQETISLTNNGDAYYTGNSVGVYTVIFYANSSSGSLASVIDTFEITSSTPVIPPSPSGGGGTTTIEKCIYIWDCTSWSICSEGKQQRECKNIGNCTGTEGKPIEERICLDALFDVTIKFADLIITENKTLKFNVSLTEKKGIEKTDVQIKYSIINSSNIEIFSQIETRAIQKNLTYEKEISEIKLKDGKYTLRVDILYGNLQRAFAEQKFEVKKGELGIVSAAEFVSKLLIIAVSLIILLILIIFILIKKRGRKEKKEGLEYKRKIKHNLKKIMSKTFLIILASFILMGVLFIGGSSMAGFVVGSARSINDNLGIFGFILVIGMLGLLTFIYKKKIIELIETRKRNRHAKNSLNGLIKKKVYTDEGDYIGKVEEAILGENKIDSLQIKLDKKIRIKEKKTKGLIVKYKDVKNVGHIVIVAGGILEKLNI